MPDDERIEPPSPALLAVMAKSGAPNPTRYPVGLVLSLMGRARACPHFRPRTGCCNGDQCELDPTGRGWVSVVDDCRFCLYLPDEVS